jgi:hypothetical protein
MKKTYHFGIPWTGLVVFLVSFAGCSKESGNPADNGSSGDGVVVIESKSATVGSGGGTVTLSDGSEVAFPAGSLASPTKVTVKTISPASYFDGADASRVVISCEGVTGVLSAPAELRVPLPGGFTEADTAAVFGGLLDEDAGAVEAKRVTVRTIDGEPYAVIQATHFSSHVVEWFFGATPPSAQGPIDIPYYGQGSSSYCWATSLHMVTQAAKYAKEREIHEIIGHVGVDEGGVTDWAFRFNETIAALVSERTGVKPTRYQWDYVNADQALNYIRKEIGLNHRPVAVYVGTWEHAVVIVGYDGSTLSTHNPNSTTVSAIGCTARPWTDFTASMGVRDKIVTLVIPKDLDSSRPLATVNITTGALEFVKPKLSDADPSRIYRFAWDYREETGYSFRETTTDTATDVLPGTVATLKQGGDIEVVNASRTTPKTVTVWLDIFGKGPQKTHCSMTKEVALGANASGRVTFDDIPVDEFRDNDTKPSSYRLQVSVYENQVMVDCADLTFTIDTITPEITSLAPSTTGVGNTMTIIGSHFGTVRGQSVVTFNGIAAADADYISWSDTEIRIKVPAGTKTGPVAVKRGSVSSNANTLAIVEQSAYTGTWNFSDQLVTAVMTWTVNGTVLKETVSQDQAFYPRYEIKTGTPFNFHISVSLSLNYTSKRWDFSDSTYTIITYKEPVFWENESPFSTYGDFPHTSNFSVTSLSGAATFNDSQQYFHTRLTYYIIYDIRGYDKTGKLINEQLNQCDTYAYAVVGGLSIFAK